MKCDDMPQYLVSLLYDELEPEEAEKIQTHIQACDVCRKAYQELLSTSKLLGKWEDADPRMNLVFVSESVSRWRTWKEKLAGLSWGRRLAIGIPAFAVLCLVILAALNFRLNYRQGEWTLAMGFTPLRQTSDPEQIINAALEENQKETLMMISQLIEQSEYRQRRESALTLAQFAQDLERQRQEDLRIVGQNMVGLQRTTEGRFHQTSSVLNDLIRLTSYNLEKK